MFRPSSAPTTMNSLRGQLIIGFVCLALGILLVIQLRSRRVAHADVPVSASDQATYISQLYDSNTQLRAQVAQLAQEVAQYKQADSTGAGNLDALQGDLQNLHMANGDVAVEGPGMTVLVEGDLTVFEVQDLVNELRNASAEVIAVNGVRVVTRSTIMGDDKGQVLVDSRPISSPYRLEAIGSPDVLGPALQRKGGLIALLKAANANLRFTVTRHETSSEADWLHLPKTALQFNWNNAKPATPVVP